MLLGKTAQSVLERMCEVEARVRAKLEWERALLEGLGKRWGGCRAPAHLSRCFGGVCWWCRSEPGTK
jgi:hypothetical protein